MIYLLLYFIFWNLVWSDFTIRGQRLKLDDRPFFQRLRWIGFGMLVALVLSGHAIEQSDWLSWGTVLILAVGSARVRVKAEEQLSLKLSPKHEL